MRHSIQRISLGIAVAVSTPLLGATAAMAQLVQSEVDAEPGLPETTQLVTSSTEVRRAVVGLLTVAAVTAILGLIYWHKTGQQARQRHASGYGGRHRPAAEPAKADAPAQAKRPPLSWPSEPQRARVDLAPEAPRAPSTHLPLHHPVGAEVGAPRSSDSVYPQPVVWRED